MKKILAAGSVLVLSLTSFAHTNDGAYFGLSFGLSNTRTVKRDLSDSAGGGNVLFHGKKFDVSGNSANASSQVLLKYASSRGDTGYRFIIGYRIWQRYAFEFTFDNFADAEFREFDGDKMHNNEYALGVQGIARFPFVYENFQFTTRLGMSYIRSNLDFRGTFTSGGGAPINVNSSIKNQSESVNNFLYGVGLAYAWNKKADLTFDFIKYNGTGKIDDIDVLQVGMIYHFGDEM